MFDNILYRRSRKPGPINGIEVPNIARMQGLMLWLCADDIAGADNDAVATWTDRSPNANNLSQGTESNKPVYKTNIVNEHSVVRFDGASADFMSLTANINMMSIQFFAVLKISNGTIIANSAYQNFQLRWSTGDKLEILKSGVTSIAISTTAMSTVNFNSIGCVISWPYYEFRLAGAADGSGTTTQTWGPINRVGRNFNTTEYLTGDIAEMLIFNRRLLTEEQMYIDNYLKMRYGL